MIELSVLLENTRTDGRFRAAHGLSLGIDVDGQRLLLDVGPGREFVLNARELGWDLGAVEALVLSHGHKDHAGGLEDFLVINPHAPVYTLDTPGTVYQAKIAGPIRVPVGIRYSAAARARTVTVAGRQAIGTHAWLIPCGCSDYPRPSGNAKLLKRTAAGAVPDDFSHEGMLVVDDSAGLAVFNSCSHRGAVNSLESVRQAFPRRDVRAYVGGLHFHDPLSGKDEDGAVVEGLCRYALEAGIDLYTGHCTGDASFTLMKHLLGDRLHRLSTGLVCRI